MPKKILQEKVFLITGASSGIGRAAALALAEQGGRLSLGARSIDRLQETAQAVREKGGEALAVQTDVTQPDQVRRLVQETLALWGKVDGLISNAGQYVQASVLDMTIADLEQSLSANFYSHIYAVQAVLPEMLRRRNGHIILMSSMDAKKGIPPDAPYVSAKCALSGFGEVLRQELHLRGIAVTTIFPGRVDTPMISHLQVPPVSAKIPPEAVAKAILRAVRTRPAEIILPPQAILLYLVNVLSPRLADWYVRVLKLKGVQAEFPG